MQPKYAQVGSPGLRGARHALPLIQPVPFFPPPRLRTSFPAEVPRRTCCEASDAAAELAERDACVPSAPSSIDAGLRGCSGCGRCSSSSSVRPLLRPIAPEDFSERVSSGTTARPEEVESV
eukprot:218839-Chlamydomonas_euryale.AAC.5